MHYYRQWRSARLLVTTTFKTYFISYSKGDGLCLLVFCHSGNLAHHRTDVYHVQERKDHALWTCVSFLFDSIGLDWNMCRSLSEASQRSVTSSGTNLSITWSVRSGKRSPQLRNWATWPQSLRKACFQSQFCQKLKTHSP